MANRKVDKTWDPDTQDYRNRAFTDVFHGKTTQVSNVPAANQADYTESFNWAAWFNIQFNRRVY